MDGVNLQIGAPFSIRAKVSATTAYTAGTVMSMENHNSLGIMTTYDKGNETSLETKVEVSNDGGTTYFQETAESISGGTVTKSLAERSYSATGSYSDLIRPIRAKLVRVSYKTTFGTVSTGSVTIQAIPLWA